MAILKDGLPLWQNYSGAHYVKNISYLFDTVLLCIQVDSYKHIH